MASGKIAVSKSASLASNLDSNETAYCVLCVCVCAYETEREISSKINETSLLCNFEYHNTSHSWARYAYVTEYEKIDHLQ